MKTFLRNLKHLFTHPLWLQTKFNGDISAEKHLLTGRLTALSNRVDVLEHNLNLKVDDLHRAAVNLINKADS
jgi:hypothetical protein